MFESSYLWTGLALILLIGIFVWKGLKPVLVSLDSRAEKIRKDIEEAQVLREEAQKLLGDYKRRHQEAMGDAVDIVEHAKAESERMRVQAEKDLSELMQRREQMALNKIRQAEADALKEVHDTTVEIASQAAALAIMESLDESARDTLTQDAINEVKKNLN